MIEQIKQLMGSDGKQGWPVAVKDRIAYFCEEGKIPESRVAVTFLWTMRDAILPKLEKRNLAIAANFYTPAGMAGMIRNMLANPYVRHIIILGEEYASKNGKGTELTSANALRMFFGKGINEERKIEGFENAVYFDKNIPTEMIRKVAESIELIDINKRMPDAMLDDKIDEVNMLLRTLKRKEPFLDKPHVFGYEKQKESFPYEGGPILVHERTIPKAWIKMIHMIYRHGRENLMNANTDRWVKEVNDMVVVVDEPQDMDLSINPFLVPLTKEKIEAYKAEILSPLLPEGKAYTYGNKLRAYVLPSSKEIRELVTSNAYKDFEFGKGEHLERNVGYKGEGCEIDQIKDVIDVLKRDLYSKACVAITWHPAEELMRKHKSSPCLVMLQPIVQDEKLNLTVFFRSHDMTQGWPENAYGCAAIQKEIADATGVKAGILTIISGSAQIYNHYYSQVEEMLNRFYREEDELYDPKGNFIIEVKDGRIIAKLMHPERGTELESYEGKSAKEVYKKIALKSQVRTDHAAYLGAELMKAEIAINEGRGYTQDQALG